MAADPPPVVDPRPALPRSTVVLLALGGATAAAFGVAAMRGVVVPVFLAIILTLCVHPLHRRLYQRGFSRGAATVASIVAVLALVLSFALILALALARFSALLPQYASQLDQVGTTVSGMLASLGFNSSGTDAVQNGFTPESITGFIGDLLGGVTDAVGGLVIILTLLILMAVDGSRVPALLAYVRPHHPGLVSALIGFATGTRRYMVTTTVLGLAQGAFNALVLVLLQVPGALLWGLLSFICSFIPNVGYFIAIVPPLFFGFLSGGWQTVVIVIVVYGVINGAIQSVIQPKYVGDAVSLSETLTFVSVLFWAVVLGPLGAILAVPLTLLVRSILIDAEPSTWWRRALTGDRTDFEVLLEDEDAERRAFRAQRKARSSAPREGHA
ncbi:AI-2E family transporter [Arthrobacter pityocampae]|uniref:AI-2E family transporter n=1 Tax=Arthrobacter pityocampae TaxID=547334 RepID=A0A2S5J0J9_9MICC|nr:AI-2E family transporter [Arthrobacter pityocampae]PPB50324.1 AI-2E family transporter [Arthrobacter pityocampae]